MRAAWMKIVHLRLDVRLADIVGQAFRPHGAIERPRRRADPRGDDPVLFDAHDRRYLFTADLRARRMISGSNT